MIKLVLAFLVLLIGMASGAVASKPPGEDAQAETHQSSPAPIQERSPVTINDLPLELMIPIVIHIPLWSDRNNLRFVSKAWHKLVSIESRQFGAKIKPEDINDRTLPLFQQCPELVMYGVSGNLPEHMKFVNALSPHLRGLSIAYGLDATDSSVAPITKLTNLIRLRLRSKDEGRFKQWYTKNKISTRGIQYIKCLTNLTQLDLTCEEGQEYALPYFTTLTNLNELSFYSNTNKIGLEFARNFTKLTNLTDLTLGCYGTIEFEDTVLRDFSSLKKLSLTAKYTHIKDASIKVLPNSLTALFIKGEKFDDQAIDQMSKLTNLQMLNLGGRVHDVFSLVSLFSRLPQLTSCYIWNMLHDATPAERRAIGKKFTRLTVRYDLLGHVLNGCSWEDCKDGKAWAYLCSARAKHTCVKDEVSLERDADEAIKRWELQLKGRNENVDSGN